VNAIKDPPFSKLDLITCRNLLIYLGAGLQKKLIPLFHYALNPGGRLFLGTSEGIGDCADLFTVLDRNSKVYQRKDDFHALQRRALDRFLTPQAVFDAALPLGVGKNGTHTKLPLRDLTEQALLQQIAPAGVLVNSQGDILYLHGHTGVFLEPTPGETGINNILKMAREGLRLSLTTALHKAATTKEIVHLIGLPIKTNGHRAIVNLSILPVTSALWAKVSSNAGALPESPLFLVVLEEAPALSPAQATLLLADDGVGTAAGVSDDLSADARIMALRAELRAKEEYLLSTHEELESSNEELKSSNEEMQSVNEELQSTNEELETAKEEMQSVNEELATVNNELNAKLTDLSRVNNDMNNLLAGTGIATVFVDQHLRVLRFTPTAAQIINLILADIGRPVGHIVSNLIGYDNLLADAQAVLDTLTPIEISVQAVTGQWFMMRIRPYRTLDNVIEGVVITFVDITDLRTAAAALARLAVVVRDSHDAITVQDLEGRTIAWNPGAVRMYGWSEQEALLLNVCDRIPPALRDEALSSNLRLARSEILKPFHTQRIARDGEVVEITMTATALLNEAGEIYAIATTERLTRPMTSESDEGTP
jgi:two-component system CheB/CheR fusion protein